MPGRSSAYDLVIIGGGPGGYVAAIKAAQLGIKTALVEKNKIGGACLHQGCIPTKALLHSADMYRKLLKASEYGIVIDKLAFNYPQFHRRKEAIIKRMFQGIQFLLKKNGVDVFEGKGQLTSPYNVIIKRADTDVEGITARNIILATGSAPTIPQTIPYDGKFVLTSDDALKCEEVPKSIIIVGGGALGVEFAHLFSILGSRVTIIELLPDILPTEDREVCDTLKKTFTKRGIEIITNASLEKVEINSGVNVSIRRSTDTIPPPIHPNNTCLKADYLLLALGRAPSLSDLGIEGLSLKCKGKYLQTNEVMETERKGLFAIGDIAGPPLLAHKASAEGLCAVSAISGKEITPIKYTNIPRVTYCYPEVASMGLTQVEAENGGYKVKTGRFPFIANSKAIIQGEYEDGFVKIITDEKNGQLLGMHAIGPNVGEMMWGSSLAAGLKGSASDISHTLFPHPTLSEAIWEASLSTLGKSLHI